MTSQSAATLRSRYVVQAASDLEENRREQRELAERLRVLEQEEALLVEILTLAERYEGALEAASPLPEQPQSEPEVTATGRRRPATPPAAARQRKAKSKAGQPLLGDILLELLRTHAEPTLAKDLREELMHKHPDREPTPQVVRNTLEALVAKGRIRRHKEDRAVMYTVA